MRFIRGIPRSVLGIIIGALVLAGTGGFLGSQALGTVTQTPTKTVTISVTNGEQGPPGPKGDTGPPGPAGSISCPTGFSEGLLVINHPGGQTTIFTCIKN